MSELYGYGDNDSVEEACRRMKEDELLTIDWAVQAQGLELMYQQTGDIDYELGRIEAQEKARQQRLLFAGCRVILETME